MKIQLLIATGDSVYAEALSEVLSERYSDAIESAVCTAPERLGELLSRRGYDVALLDSAAAARADLSAVRLPLLLWDGDGTGASDLKKLRKYQRVSSIAREVLEQYALAAPSAGGYGLKEGEVSVFWSPAGGVGKTSAALAYASGRAAEGVRTLYLNLECFSSTPACLPAGGKSISAVFDKLGTMETNLEVLLRGVRQQDRDTGVFYFGPPDNYDDVHILTSEDLRDLVSACREGVDEVVVDLSCCCDERTRKLFEAASRVFLVYSPSHVAQEKLKQFLTQNNLFERMRGKIVLVANMGARVDALPGERAVCLPYIQSGDPAAVCRALSTVRLRA